MHRRNYLSHKKQQVLFLSQLPGMKIADFFSILCWITYGLLRPAVFLVVILQAHYFQEQIYFKQKVRFYFLHNFYLTFSQQDKFGKHIIINLRKSSYHAPDIFV